MAMYAASGVIAKATVAEPRWEYFVVGVTSSIAFSGQTYSFQKPVGFVMGLTKNRVNALMYQNTSGSLPTSSSSSLTATDNFDNTITSAAPLVITQGPVADRPALLKKNKWIEQVSSCLATTTTFSDTCFYYAFYDANKAFLK